jgi:hypothetical protein
LQRREKEMNQTIKETIEFTQNEYEVVKQIAVVFDTTVNGYVNNVVKHAIEEELENHDNLGLEFCKMLKKQFFLNGGSE